MQISRFFQNLHIANENVFIKLPYRYFNQILALYTYLYASRQIGLFEISVLLIIFLTNNSSTDSFTFWVTSIAPTARFVLFTALLNCTMRLVDSLNLHP